MIQKKVFRNRKFIIIFLLTLILASLTYSSLIVADDDDEDDEDDDDDEDFAKDVGYISIGLLAGGCLNVVVLSIYKLSRRFLNDENKKGSTTKETIRKVYLKTRKPLNYLHYLLTLAGTSIILYHGITFVGKDEEVGIIGWVSVGIFIFYVITGAIIKLKTKPLWNSTRARKILNRTHRTLILFLVVIAIHVVHILLAD